MVIAYEFSVLLYNLMGLAETGQPHEVNK